MTDKKLDTGLVEALARRLCPKCGEETAPDATGRERCAACRRAYMREYRRTDKGRAARAAWFKTETGKKALRRQDKRHNEAHPDRYRARRTARLMFERGRAERPPCSRCGATPAEMHHPDHSKPLEIVLLCRPCHRAEHARP